MSTKRLARTVIEGGRVKVNREDRRASNSEQRATERAYMAKVLKDPECFDEDILEERQIIRKEFDDKLGPMYSWLRAQVGRKWSEVRSEIFKKFDTRTTAGRHITFDHLLSSVVETLSGFDKWGYLAEGVGARWRHAEYYVDDAGILQPKPQRAKFKWSQRWRHSPSPVFLDYIRQIGEWLSGRMIGELGGVLYWLSSSDGIWSAEWKSDIDRKAKDPRFTNIDLKYYSEEISEYKVRIFSTFTGYNEEITRTGLHKEWIVSPAGFKQRGALTEEEVKIFKTFPDDIQAEILQYGSARLRA